MHTVAVEPTSGSPASEFAAERDGDVTRNGVLPVQGHRTVEPDFDRDVHVSDGTLDVTWKKNLPRPTVPMLQMPGVYWFMVIPTITLHGSLMLGKALGWALWISGLIGAVLCVSMLIPVVFWLRNLHSLRGSHAIVPVSREDERFRLRLIVTTRRQALDALSDDSWEPVIVPLRFALPDRKGWAIAAWVVLMLTLMAIGFWIRMKFVRSGVPFTPLDTWTVLAISTVPFMWLWPAYLRIAPGRVDVLRCGFLGLGRVRCRSVDVRDAKVRVVSAMGGMLQIEPREGDPLFLPLVHLRPQTIVRPLFMAARWRGELPELPSDALLG